MALLFFYTYFPLFFYFALFFYVSPLHHLIILSLPILIASIVLFQRSDDVNDRNLPYLQPRFVGLVYSLFSFLGLFYVYSEFNDFLIFPSLTIQNTFVNYGSALSLGFGFYVGLNSVSMLLLLLTAFTFVVAVLASWTIVYQPAQYFAYLLFTLFILIHVFTQQNLLYFYLFYEAVAIPLTFIIAVWGSRPEKIGAAYRLLFYTIFSSIPFLLAILYLLITYGSVNWLDFISNGSSVVSSRDQTLVWLPFFVAFSAKIPLVPLHTWLPEAHVEAPTAGSIILAAILLKLGLYGMFYFVIPLFPQGTNFFRPLVFVIALVTAVYGSFAAVTQLDFKRVVAYSSVAHMGVCTASLFSDAKHGILGSVLMMLTHGFTSTGMFFSAGFLYERYGTRNVADYFKLALVFPVFSLLFFFYSLSNIGFPGFASFMAEMFIFFGLVVFDPIFAILFIVASFLSIYYTFLLFSRVIFSGWPSSFLNYRPSSKMFFSFPEIPPKHFDASYREFFVMVLPLVMLVFFLFLSPVYYWLYIGLD